jgi:glycosyltransferase involved in cell wall biosynthesis
VSDANVTLVHDYLTQRGGAERVVVSLLRAFPGAPLYTAIFAPRRTYPEFAAADVRPSPLSRIRPLRVDHRRSLPLLAPTFSAMHVGGDVVVCSSSGWAHGVRTEGRKIVYCHNPARWLYQQDQYLMRAPAPLRVALGAVTPGLRAWDRRAAASAHRYLCNSTSVQARIREVYGIDATVVPPPPAVDATGPQRPVPGVEEGALLCVSRLQPYKHVDVVVAALDDLPGERLVVVGKGPDRDRLGAMAGERVTFLDRVDDAQLRWLYAHCAGLVAASFEDFGLTPLEAAAFGRPVAALRFGGYLDTVTDGESGVFFDAPEPAAVAAAVRRMLATPWDRAAILAHADRFAEHRFVERMRSVVAEEAALAG